MLSDLFQIHHEVMACLPTEIHRYLYHDIRWEAQALAIIGSRGVGKTTLMCQALKSQYQSVEKGLYISADNIHVLSTGLFAIAQQYFQHGGEAIFIDEVHKYPDWSLELKNIIDTFKSKKIVFSASSALELKQSKADLSRRVVYYEMQGLSFREYLHFAHGIQLNAYSFDEILTQHVSIASELKSHTMLKHFQDYLQYGYYPFFLEGIADYTQKISNVIEKVIFEDVAVIYNLKPSSQTVLKKLIWLVATSNGLSPVIDTISKNIGVSREMIYQSLEHLANAGIFTNVYPDAQGAKLIRKPGKVYIDNTNLLYSINSSLKQQHNDGHIRETFFVNQVSPWYSLKLHDKGDYLIEDKIVIEVGGPSKTHKQIKGLENAYLALDNIEIGMQTKIPLYLFGLLY